MNSISLPVVHPAFQNLKRSGRLLHLTAGILILSHAFTHLNQPQSNPVYFWCQLIIAIDIFILVFAGRQMLIALPMVNLFFRFIEFLFFLGMATLLLFETKWIMGGIHFLISVMYIYLFYCERNVTNSEYVAIHHTGITIPALPENKFFIWSNISAISATYDSITIDTSLNRSYHFSLSKNLTFDELDQIHEFCKHYLGR